MFGNEVQIIVSGDISRWRKATEQVINTARQTNEKVSRGFGSSSAVFQNLRRQVMSLGGALAALGSGVSIAGIVRATTTMDNLRASFLAATGDVATAGREMQYVDELSDRLGTSLTDTARSWARFRLAAEESSLTLSEARTVFEGVSTAAVGLGLSAGETAGLMSLLERSFERGSVLGQEFRRQIRMLPGGLQVAAAALGTTSDGFLAMLRRGEVLVDEFLPKFGVALQEKFAQPAEQQAERVGAAMSRVGDSVTKLLATIGGGAVGQQVVNVLNALAGGLGEEGFLAGVQERQARRAEMLSRILQPIPPLAMAVWSAVRLLGQGLDLVASGLAKAVDLIWQPLAKLGATLKETAEAIGLFKKSAADLAGIGGVAGIIAGVEIEEPKKPPRVPEEVTDAVDKLTKSLQKKAAEARIAWLELTSPDEAIRERAKLVISELRDNLRGLARFLPADLQERVEGLLATLATGESQVAWLREWHKQMGEVATAADHLDAEFSDLVDTLNKIDPKQIAVATGTIKEALQTEIEIVKRSAMTFEQGIQQRMTAIQSAIEQLARLGAETEFTDTLLAQLGKLKTELNALRATDFMAGERRRLEDTLAELDILSAINQEERTRAEMAKRLLELKRQGIELDAESLALLERMVEVDVQLDAARQRFIDLKQTIEEAFTGAIRNIQSGFADLWFNVFTGGIRSVKDFARAMAENMLRTIANINAAIMTAALEQGIQAMTGSSIKDLITQASGSIAGTVVPGSSDAMSESRRLIAEMERKFSGSALEQSQAATQTARAAQDLTRSSFEMSGSARELLAAGVELRVAAQQLQQQASSDTGIIETLTGSGPQKTGSLDVERIAPAPWEFWDWGSWISDFDAAVGEELGETLAGAFSESGAAGQASAGWLSSLGTGLSDIFSSIFGSLGSLFSSGGDWIWQLLSSVGSMFLGSFGFGFKKGGIVPGVKALWDMQTGRQKNVGHFQSGGVVDRPNARLDWRGAAA